MQTRITLHGIGAIIAICFGSWDSLQQWHGAIYGARTCRGGTTCVTRGCCVIHDDGESCRNGRANGGRPAVAPLPSRRWRKLANRRRPDRCVPIQGLNTVTGWQRECGHNPFYFSRPDYQCCIDDGLGQCVPGSEQSYTASPEEPQLRSRKLRSRKLRSRKLRSRQLRSRQLRSRQLRSRKSRSRKLRSRKSRSRKSRSRRS